MIVSKPLLSVLALASKDGTRPLLNAVRLYKEDGNVVSVATNGYILGEVIESTPPLADYPELPNDHKLTDPDEVLIPATTAKRLVSAIKKSDMLPILNYAVVEADTATTTDLEEITTLTFRSPSGNYPEYRKLLTDERAKGGYVKTTIDPKNLKQVLEMLKDETSVAIEVSSNKMAGVFITSESNGVKKTAVIMPMRS